MIDLAGSIEDDAAEVPLPNTRLVKDLHSRTEAVANVLLLQDIVKADLALDVSRDPDLALARDHTAVVVVAIPDVDVAVVQTTVAAIMIEGIVVATGIDEDLLVYHPTQTALHPAHVPVQDQAEAHPYHLLGQLRGTGYGLATSTGNRRPLQSVK